MSDAPETILIAEDSEDDVFFLKRALKEAKIGHATQVVTDGCEAIDYLAGDGPFADRLKHPLPRLVFLDLKLPYKHGFDVLAWIRAQPSLAAMPVVILTSSSEIRDVEQAREVGADSFLVKPAASVDLRDLFQRLWGDKTNLRNEHR